VGLGLLRPPGLHLLTAAGRSNGRLSPHQRRFSHDPRSYRSGLEEKLAQQLTKAGITFRFEEFKLAFTEPAKARTYTPDFALPNGIVIESKGLFTTEDRQKMRIIRETYPDLDIRFVFSNARQRISKTSKTTYAMWAEKYGYPWAHKEIPPDWLEEPPQLKRIQALKEAEVH
jgi:hypothetical protein